MMARQPAEAPEPEHAIKPIDPTSVHRLTSGQVVVDLQTAVKELIENSLDAGASNIEVRFKDYGLKSIEVIDNGCGIAPADYDSIALKHHTSKLAAFEDLATVRSFGFRGEALSSLCGLSGGVTVTTATAAEAPAGTVLEIDARGHVTSKSARAARQRGTTVTVAGLFAPLPVRRRELERNAKREFGKALHLLTAYALVPCTQENRGVRLSVSNHPDGGRKSVQIRTDGTPSLRAAVGALWGPRALEGVVELDIEFGVETEKAVLRRRGADATGAPSNVVRVRGLVSRFSAGCGRAGADRQFFFINGRPCSPTKVQKAFNEVYRTFNASQAPFVVADFMLPTDSCDVNVSPDKRTILLHSEANLIEALKTALNAAFSESRSTFALRAPAGTQKDAAPVPVPARRTSRRADGPKDAEAGRALETETEMEMEMETETQAGGIEASPPGPPVPAAPAAPASGPRADARTQDGAESGSGEGRGTPVHAGARASGASSYVDVDNGAAAEEEAEEAARDAGVEEDAARKPSSARNGAGSGDEPDPGRPAHERAGARDDATRAAPAVPAKRASPSADADTDLDTDADADADAEGSSAAARRVRSAACVERIMNEGETGGGADVAESRRDRRRAREVQMVLDTSGASWNLKPGAPPAKKRRGDGAGGGAGGGSMAPEKGLSARGSLRARLRGFARTGSQVVVDDLEEEDEDGDGGPAGDFNAGASSHSEGRSEAGMDVDPPETRAPDADAAMDVDESHESPIAGASGDDRAKRQVIDLSHENSADTKEPTDKSSSLVAETSTEASSAQANAALRTEVERVRSRAEDDVSLAFDLARVTGAWHGLRARLSRKARAPHADRASAPPAEEQVLQSKAGLQSTDDAGAGEALARVLRKEDFRTMSVVGQFNLGFIVARRRQGGAAGEAGAVMDDLFIVDQHAADEKYNFEMLQQTTRIESQRLFMPRQLEITAADKLVATENLDVLKQNGFELDPGEENDSGEKREVKLVAQPFSKSTVFDMKDLEELLHLMRDLPPGTMVRCSKARAMFAMRACRKSIMVGKALDAKQMTAVVRHMGAMEQPWNCPHGRPTMRHLSDLMAVGRWDAARKTDWAAYRPRI